MNIFKFATHLVLTRVSYLKRSELVGKGLHLRAVYITSDLCVISCFKC